MDGTCKVNQGIGQADCPDHAGGVICVGLGRTARRTSVFRSHLGWNGSRKNSWSNVRGQRVGESVNGHLHSHIQFYLRRSGNDGWILQQPTALLGRAAMHKRSAGLRQADLYAAGGHGKGPWSKDRWSTAASDLEKLHPNRRRAAYLNNILWRW